MLYYEFCKHATKRKHNKQESVNAKVADFSINKSSTDVEIKRITEILEKQYEIQLKTSKIKRNSNNEIIGHFRTTDKH